MKSKSVIMFFILAFSFSFSLTICPLSPSENLQSSSSGTFGFLKALKVDLRFNPKAKNVFIMGAGGSGSACAIKLAEVAKKIFIFDIDKKRLKLFAGRFLKYYGTKRLFIVGNTHGA